jgi:hypothetical protein
MEEACGRAPEAALEKRHNVGAQEGFPATMIRNQYLSAPTVPSFTSPAAISMSSMAGSA